MGDRVVILSGGTDGTLTANRLHRSLPDDATITVVDGDVDPGAPPEWRAHHGAAFAPWAAGEPDSEVAAVVSRGGRPDLDIPRLAAVRAPTLLIVGGRDEVVVQLNREARAHLRCENDLAVVPGAAHLFEEAGTLAHAAGLARDWFEHHFDRPNAARRLHVESGAGARRR